MRPAEATGKGVDKHEILQEAAVGLKESDWDAHVPQDGVQERPEDLVETLPDIGGSPDIGCVSELGNFNVHRGRVPSVLGSDPR